MNRLRFVVLIGMAALTGLSCDSEPIAEPEYRPPEAEAGPHQTLWDRDGNGWEPAVLDGSASRRGTNRIVGYQWTERGTPVIGATFDDGLLHIFVDVGRHSLVLTITDDTGYSDSDTTVIEVKAMNASDPPTDPQSNDRPTARIDMPCDGLGLYEGRGTYFAGSAWDVYGPLSYETFEWDLDGRVIPGCGEWDGWAEAGCGYGGWIESFELGPHVLTLTVTDSDGARGSASVTITGFEFRDASFTDDILSFMLMYCANCHGAERAEAGIRLDSYEAIMTGGNSNGPLVVEGDPTGGTLIPQVLSDHFHVEGFGTYPSRWLGETILPVWILEGARNTDHPHPPVPRPCN